MLCVKFFGRVDKKKDGFHMQVAPCRWNLCLIMSHYILVQQFLSILLAYATMRSQLPLYVREYALNSVVRVW